MVEIQLQSFNTVAAAINATFPFVEKQENWDAERAPALNIQSSGQYSCETASRTVDTSDNPHHSAEEETITFREHVHGEIENNFKDHHSSSGRLGNLQANVLGQIPQPSSGHIDITGDDAIEEKNRVDLNDPPQQKAPSPSRDEIAEDHIRETTPREDMQDGRRSQENVGSSRISYPDRQGEITSEETFLAAPIAVFKPEDIQITECGTLHKVSADAIGIGGPIFTPAVCPRSDSFGSDAYEDARESLDACSLCGSVYDDADLWMQWDESDSMSLKARTQNGSSDARKNDRHSRFGEVIYKVKDDTLVSTDESLSLRSRKNDDAEEAVESTETPVDDLLSAAKSSKRHTPLSKLLFQEDGPDEPTRRSGREADASVEAKKPSELIRPEESKEVKANKAKWRWRHCVCCT